MVMKFQLELSIPDEITETQRRFIMNQMQIEAKYIHELLWPRTDHKMGCGFINGEVKLD